MRRNVLSCHQAVHLFKLLMSKFLYCRLQACKLWITTIKIQIKNNSCADVVFCSYMNFYEQYSEFDAFITSPEPSNPWTSDNVEFWEQELTTSVFAVPWLISIIILKTYYSIIQSYYMLFICFGSITGGLVQSLIDRPNRIACRSHELM